MADVSSVVNMSEVGNAIWEKLLPSISPLITFFKVVGIVLLICIIFLIIRALFRLKTSFNIGKIAKNVEQINGKLDILIEKLGRKEQREKISEGKDKKAFLENQEKVNKKLNKKEKREKISLNKLKFVFVSCFYFCLCLFLC